MQRSGKVISIQTAAEKIKKDPFDAYVFTFTRNPYDRLVSCWADKLHRPKVYNNFNFMEAGFKHKMAFDAFVDKVIKVPHYMANEHYIPHYKNLVLDGELLVPVDNIYKFEHLSDHFNNIVRPNVNPNLPMLTHVRRSSHKSWQEYYNEEIAEKVYNYYKKDFEMFNYSKESWRF